MSDVTTILAAIENGDEKAADELLPLVYQELRQLAASRMAREQPGQTLDATGLVHEAYVRLVDSEQLPNWNSRGHFFGAAAEAMRRIMIERARHKKSIKAGGKLQRQDVEIVDPEKRENQLDVLALDEALQKLAIRDPRKVELVKLRFFAGMTIEQAATVLGISTSTADNDWAYARSWLKVEMDGKTD